MLIDNIAYFATATIRMATPLLIAALGMVIAERSGIINIGGEGIMLLGAFTAYAVARFSQSYWFGLLASMAAGAVMIAVFAVACITYKSNQNVVGMSINLFCAGLTSVIYRRLFASTGTISGMMIESFPNAPIPLLSKIPILGEVFFDHNIFVYFGLIMVFVLWWVLKKSSLGIKIIAVGEHPRAADSLGINVIKTRYLTTLFSGILLGIAGAYLSIAQTNSFAENMTGGKGYIALAMVVLGTWNPIGIFVGAILFGGANALQMTIQNSPDVNIPSKLILMIPYIVTVITVLVSSRNQVNSPSARGKPYEKS
ncbi:MAG: ABC transporter permease [Bacillota bacterium]